MELGEEFAKYAGRKIHYVDHFCGQGTADSKPTLLFVHGNPTWSFYYHDLISSLGNQHRCVAIDHLGCGLSDSLPSGAVTLAQRTDMLVALIEELDLRDIIFCVHDWGGAIGLGAAVRVPDRVAGLVIFNTAAFVPPYVPLRIRACRLPLLGRPLVQGLNLFAGPAAWMATEKGLSPASKAGLLHPYQSWERRRAVYEFVADIPTSPSHPTWQTLEQLEGDLGSLSHLPISMIWGMKDWCFQPRCLDRLNLHFPTAEIHRLEAAGHYVVLDEPKIVRATVQDFASRISSGAAIG